MEKVSLIIPIYNAEMYLKRCLDSVIAQTYPALEILLVNDGSRDHSLAICEEYEKKDDRIHIIDKENTGVSDSRNVAMAAATGTYLQFMDSDDWLTPDATERLVTLAEMTRADLVIGDFYRVDGDHYALKSHIPETGVMDRRAFAEHMMEDPADFYYGVMWNKLYRRDLVEKYHLGCTTELNWCEDFLFNLAYIRRAERFCALQAPVYYYMKRKGSLAGSQLLKTNVMQVRLLLLEYYKELYQSIGLYEDNKAKINAFVLMVARDGSVNRLPLVGDAEKLDEDLVLEEPSRKKLPKLSEKRENKDPETEGRGKTKDGRHVRKAEDLLEKLSEKPRKAGDSVKALKEKAFVHVEHTFQPVFDDRCRVLILGTFPSVKSRENQFYYGHPQNRFWRVISALTGELLPVTIDDKKRMLLSHHIGIWDVVQECDIHGSSDSSIRNVVPSDIASLVKDCPDIRIFGNGDAACRLYRKYCQESVGRDITRLPSTSPANAIFTVDRLMEAWEEAVGPLLENA